MNELGFAFLRRMTIDPSSPMANAPIIAQADHANATHKVVGTVSILNLLDPKHGATDSTLPRTA